MPPLRNSEWVVYSKRPFGGPKEVLRYLARYTHRVAISNRDGHALLYPYGAAALARVTRRSGDRAHALIGLSLRVSRECGLTPPGEIVSAACEEMNGVGQSDQREQPQVFVSVSLQVAASPAIACE